MNFVSHRQEAFDSGQYKFNILLNLWVDFCKMKFKDKHLQHSDVQSIKYTTKSFTNWYIVCRLYELCLLRI